MGRQRTGNGVDKVYYASQAWVDRALQADDPLFTPGKAIWTSERPGEVRRQRKMVRPADNSNVRPVWFVTGGNNWRDYRYFWQHYLPPHSHLNHNAEISRMQPGDRIAMKADEFRNYAENRHISVGIYAIGRITNTRDHCVDVDDDWLESMPDPDENRPIGNYAVADISDRFLVSCIRSSPYYFEAFRADWKRVFYSILSGAKAAVGTLYPANYEYTTLANQCIWSMEPDDAATRAFITDVFGSGAVDSNPPDQPSPPFPTLAKKLYLPADFLTEINTLLEDKQQVIFQGPPGTGKTYVAQELAEHIAGSPSRVTLVQFHPSYAYEDFVQGYRPDSADDGQLTYMLRDGPLLRAAKAATEGGKHFLIIDEINRSNLAKVFGELYFLLEYRDREINLNTPITRSACPKTSTSSGP